MRTVSWRASRSITRTRFGRRCKSSPSRPDVHKVSGLYVIVTKRDIFLFADTHVNIDPSAEDLAEVALLSAEVAENFGMEPRVAMLSFSNFGSTRHPFTEKVRRATELVKQRNPKLMVDGEMMADTAVVPELTGRIPLLNPEAEGQCSGLSQPRSRQHGL
jgi:phosphotransacetylase